MWPRQVGGGGGGRQPHVRRAAAHSAAPAAGAVQPHQQPPIQQALCVLRCCGELLVSGLLQPPAASLSWLAQQLSVICHVSAMSVSSQQSAACTPACSHPTFWSKRTSYRL